MVGKFENITNGRFKKNIYLEMNKWKLKNIKEKIKKIIFEWDREIIESIEKHIWKKKKKKRRR